MAHDVERPGLDAPRDLGQPLVPIRVQLDSSLLHDHPGVVLPGIEGETAVIEAHVCYLIGLNFAAGSLLYSRSGDLLVVGVTDSCLVDQAGGEADG